MAATATDRPSALAQRRALSSVVSAAAYLAASVRCGPRILARAGMPYVCRPPSGAAFRGNRPAVGCKSCQSANRDGSPFDLSSETHQKGRADPVQRDG